MVLKLLLRIDSVWLAIGARLTSNFLAPPKWGRFYCAQSAIAGAHPWNKNALGAKMLLPATKNTMGEPYSR
jgi:hypothetical protein